MINANRRLCDLTTKVFPSLRKRDHTVETFSTAVSAAISAANNKMPRILEIGSIDRPLLHKSPSYHYTGLDIDINGTCKEQYDHFLHQDANLPIDGEYDIVFSRMVMEHIPNNAHAWKNIYDSLSPGGITTHIFPGGQHPYSLATRLVGHRIQKKLIRILRPHAVKTTGYRAYYDNCTPRMVRQTLSRTGFTDIHILVSYDAADYFTFFWPAFLCVVTMNRVLETIRAENFASNIFVFARKPLRTLVRLAPD